MKIIALDSSGLVAGAAILQDDELIGEYTVNYKKTHSQTLLPMLEELKNMTELELDTVDAVAVAGGPGSFTGLRIGSATAKGLAWTLNVPIISVSTTEAMAYHFYGSDKLVCPVMDARRRQVYCGIYTFERTQEGQTASGQPDGGVRYRLQAVLDACALAVEELIGRLNALRREVIFLGDGVPVYRDIITEKITVPFSFAPPHCNRQRAANVASLGAVYLKNGKIQSAAEHTPKYLRLSQAERERMEAGQGEKAPC